MAGRVPSFPEGVGYWNPYTKGFPVPKNVTGPVQNRTGQKRPGGIMHHDGGDFRIALQKTDTQGDRVLTAPAALVDPDSCLGIWVRHIRFDQSSGLIEVFPGNSEQDQPDFRMKQTGFEGVQEKGSPVQKKKLLGLFPTHADALSPGRHHHSNRALFQGERPSPPGPSPERSRTTSPSSFSLPKIIRPADV